MNLLLLLVLLTNFPIAICCGDHSDYYPDNNQISRRLSPLQRARLPIATQEPTYYSIIPIAQRIQQAFLQEEDRELWERSFKEKNLGKSQ